MNRRPENPTKETKAPRQNKRAVKPFSTRSIGSDRRGTNKEGVRETSQAKGTAVQKTAPRGPSYELDSGHDGPIEQTNHKA